MKPLRIGIVVESTGLPVRQAIAQAAKMQAEGIQVDASGDLAPDRLGATGRRELKNLLRSFNQELAALAVPLRRGLDSAENQQPRLEHLCQVMELSMDLGVPRGRAVPETTRRLRDAAREYPARALSALGAHGDRIGCALALEIGFDAGEKVKEYLDGFDTGSLKVTYDPANMLMHGHDPLANLAPLKELIAHLHARDARSSNLSRGLEEVPLGAGDVDWMAFTATLQVLDFDGFLTVKRDQGEDRFHDVAAGVKFLRRFTPPAI